MPRTLREAGEIIREALDPMVDIEVESVQTEALTPTQAVAHVRFRMIALPGEGIANISPENVAVARIPLPSIAGFGVDTTD
jgi:hypothetical protein